MDRRQFLSVAAVGGVSITVSGPPARASDALASRTLRPVSARRADSLCNSYMINTKIGFAPTVYGYTDAVVDLLEELGVRSVRERVTTSANALGTQKQMRAMPALARSGIRWHATVGLLENWRTADRTTRETLDFLVEHYRPRGGDLSDVMHSLGGCNEVDGLKTDDPNWPKHARIMQRELWQRAKSRPQTRDIPIAGPSTRTDFSPERARQLGDLSHLCDWGNAHLYQHGVSPTKFIDKQLKTLSICFPGVRRHLFSETGYNNSPQDNLAKSLPERPAAIYAVRGICDFFKRESIYARFELLDDPNRIDYTDQQTINQTAEREAHFGLVAMTKHTVAQATPDTWRKKLEFYATKRFLHLMSDQGPDFTPADFRIEVTGGGQDLQKLLLQKRNGKHYLLVWRDVEVSTAYSNARRLVVPRRNLTVDMGTARPVAIYDPIRSDRPVETHSARRRFSMHLGGRLKILEIG